MSRDTLTAARVLKAVTVQTTGPGAGTILLTEDDMREAYERGRVDAIADLATSADAAQQRAVEAIDRIVAELNGRHAEVVEVHIRAVAAAAIDVAEWVLRHPLPETTRGLVARLSYAAESLIPSAQATVHVSATDAETVAVWAARHPELTVTVDAHLTTGNATLETENGRADVSVAAALRVAAEMLGIDPTGYPA